MLQNSNLPNETPTLLTTFSTDYAKSPFPGIVRRLRALAKALSFIKSENDEVKRNPLVAVCRPVISDLKVGLYNLILKQNPDLKRVLKIPSFKDLLEADINQCVRKCIRSINDCHVQLNSLNHLCKKASCYQGLLNSCEGDVNKVNLVFEKAYKILLQRKALVVPLKKLEGKFNILPQALNGATGSLKQYLVSTPEFLSYGKHFILALDPKHQPLTRIECARLKSSIRDISFWLDQLSSQSDFIPYFQSPSLRSSLSTNSLTEYAKALENYSTTIGKGVSQASELERDIKRLLEGLKTEVNILSQNIKENEAATSALGCFHRDLSLTCRNYLVEEILKAGITQQKKFKVNLGNFLELLHSLNRRNFSDNLSPQIVAAFLADDNKNLVLSITEVERLLINFKSLTSS